MVKLYQRRTASSLRLGACSLRLFLMKSASRLPVRPAGGRSMTITKTEKSADHRKVGIYLELARVECAFLKREFAQICISSQKNLYVGIAPNKNYLSHRRIIQPSLIKWLISEPNQPGTPCLSKRSGDPDFFRGSTLG